MPRSAIGIFSLSEPALVPFSPMVNTVVNSVFSDIGTGLTQSVATTGVSSLSAGLPGAAGIVTVPGYTFDTDQDTGWYLISANSFAFVVGGIAAISFGSDQSVTRVGDQVFEGAVEYEGTIEINATATISGDLISSGDLNVSGALVLSSVVQFTSTVSFSGSVHFGSNIEIVCSTTAGYIQMSEITPPASAAANSIRLYIRESGGSTIGFTDENGVSNQIGKVLLQAGSASGVANLDIALTTYNSKFNNFAINVLNCENVSSVGDLAFRYSQDGGTTFLATASVYQWGIMGEDVAAIAPIGNTSSTINPISVNVSGGMAEVLLLNVNNVSGFRSKTLVKAFSGGNGLTASPRMWRIGCMITATQINAVRFIMSPSADLQNLKYELYGLT